MRMPSCLWLMVLSTLLTAASGCGREEASQPPQSKLSTSTTSTTSKTEADQVAPSTTSETGDSKSIAASESATTNNAQPETDKTPDGVPPAETPTRLPADLLESQQLVPLNKQGTLLADTTSKRLLVKSKVCLTEGQLEMLLCLKDTKEHESILSFEGEAYMIHAALVAWGLEKGAPAKFDLETEKFTPATGPKIDVFLHYVDRSGKLRREPAQHWVRFAVLRYFGNGLEKLPEDLTLPEDSPLRYDPVNKWVNWFGIMTEKQRDQWLAKSADPNFRKIVEQIHVESQPRPMRADWVFVGSYEIDDPEAGKRYQAEGGYVICVANFPMALLDVSIESTSVGEGNQTYEAWTEHLPPRGSEVIVELVPRGLEKSQ